MPQGEVLPYADAVVCHGGSGTMLGATAAGCPTVIAPLFADQPDNARLVEAAGAGVAVFDPDALALRTAIEHVLSDPGMRAAAESIAAEMASMPDMNASVDVMLTIASGG